MRFKYVILPETKKLKGGEILSADFLNFDGKVALAPMAGVADRAFRELCRSYGAAYTVLEMASAKGISLGDKKSKELLTITESERPAGAQIFGNDPYTMAVAAEKALEFNPQFIDINMGCPAPKVAASWFCRVRLLLLHPLARNALQAQPR